MEHFFENDPEPVEVADMDVTLLDTRFTLKIAGSNSNVYANAMTQARVLIKRIAKRHGTDVLSFDDQKEVVRFRAARVVVGWEGVKVPFSPEAVERLLIKYPTLVKRIIDFSDDDENFIRPCGAAAANG